MDYILQEPSTGIPIGLGCISVGADEFDIVLGLLLAGCFLRLFRFGLSHFLTSFLFLLYNYITIIIYICKYWYFKAIL